MSVPAVTEPPTTEPPITEPPTTEPLTTEPPTTEPPITEPAVATAPGPALSPDARANVDAAYRLHGPRIRRFTLAIAKGNADLSETLTQETFLALCHAYARDHDVRNVEAYLIAIARNACARHALALRHEAVQPSDGLVNHPDGTDMESTHIWRLEFAAACAELTDAQREVLGLVLAGYRNGEIATLLDVKASTVRTHREQIRRRLAHVRPDIQATGRQR
jgi:RNA polymerase sigma factor (sigma-70 family)